MKKAISFLSLFFMVSLIMLAQQKGEKKSDEIPEEFKVSITGRLLYEDKSPVIEKEVTLHQVIEVDGEIRASLKFEDGKILNPQNKTDNTGKFMIIFDRRLWKEFRKFTLSAHIKFTATYLKDLKGIPIVIEVDEETKTVDLGDILVKR